MWAFDASKQMIGAGFAHVANLTIAILLYSYEEAHYRADKEVDQVGSSSFLSSWLPAATCRVLTLRGIRFGTFQCAFYFVNFTLDTTLGVFLNFVFLEAFSLLAKRFVWTSVMTPGDYGDPIRIRSVAQFLHSYQPRNHAIFRTDPSAVLHMFRPWLLQLASWILVIFVTKFVISLFILALEEPLGTFAVWLFKPLQEYPDVELAVVMIACPCLMNALQFWIQDSFLKKDIHDESFLVADQSPATVAAANKKLGTPSDDETDDDARLEVVTDKTDKGKTDKVKAKQEKELKAVAG